jgi:hypothetical protein
MDLLILMIMPLFALMSGLAVLENFFILAALADIHNYH